MSPKLSTRSSSTLNKRTEFIVGDPSGDGHGKAETFHILSNLTYQQIVAAHKKGQKLLDLQEDICSCYEDSTIPLEYARKLESVGFKKWAGWDFGLKRDAIEEVNCESAGDFLDIYLFFVWYADNTFRFIVQDPPKLHIGGYGLFT